MNYTALRASHSSKWKNTSNEKPESARQLRERLEAVEKENFILKSHLKTTKKNELTTKIVRKLLQLNVFDEQIKLNKLRDQYERKSEMINDLVKRVVSEVVDLKETFLSVEEVEEMVEEVLEKRSKEELCKVIYVTPWVWIAAFFLFPKLLCNF